MLARDSDLWARAFTEDFASEISHIPNITAPSREIFNRIGMTIKLFLLLLLVAFRLHAPCCAIYFSTIGPRSFFQYWPYSSRHVYIGIIFLFIEIPDDANTTPSQNLIGYPTLSQEYCKPIGQYRKIMSRQLWTLTCSIRFGCHIQYTIQTYM